MAASGVFVGHLSFRDGIFLLPRKGAWMNSESIPRYFVGVNSLLYYDIGMREDIQKVGFEWGYSFSEFSRMIQNVS